MTTREKAPVLVVLQLSGGNDYLNTVIPYNDPLYRDYRPTVGIPDEQILPLDGEVGLHPSMGPIQRRPGDLQHGRERARGGRLAPRRAAVRPRRGQDLRRLSPLPGPRRRTSLARRAAATDAFHSERASPVATSA